MRRIKQIDALGCGVACAAMLTGKSYEEIRDHLFPDGVVVGTSTWQIRKLLLKLDMVVIAKRLIPYRTRDYRKLRKNALVKVVPRNIWPVRNWHWVAWDAFQKKIYDPSFGEIWDDDHRHEFWYPQGPVSYLAVGEGRDF